MKTLILVDLQNDFLPGGSLSVRAGDAVIEPLNRIIPQFELVLATKDWHPPDHISFADNHPGKGVGEVIESEGFEQILWPRHCVQGSQGAEFAPQLDTGRIERVFYKGADPKIDSYSAFFDNRRRAQTGLEQYLRQRGVTGFHLAGLATDYCVKYSALDARQLGFRVQLIVDACRGVNLKPGDVDRALQQATAAGAELVTSAALA